MDRFLNQTERSVRQRGPGKSPALLGFILCLIEAFILTQSASSAGFQSFRPYTPALSNSGDARTGGGRDSRFDSKRAVDRFRLRARQDEENKKRSSERQRDTQQAQKVEEDIVQKQRMSQETSRQEHQEADFIYGRTTGLDNYSVDINGGVWRSHVGLLVEAWNVFSQDVYGNVSRSHLTDFQYNDLLNTTGMRRTTVDQAGRVTETVVSDITYMEGEVLRNYLSENQERSRTEVTTTFHPTGDRVTRTKIYDLVYEDDKLVAQKAEITDLSGPNNTIIQETYDMAYDGKGNVSSSKTRLTDTVTGVVTESETKSHFDGNRMVSSVVKSTTFDPHTHTLTQQESTQSIAYGNGVSKMDAQDVTTLYSADSEGNITDDFKTVTESTQVMDFFHGIPNAVEIASKNVTHDTIESQTVQSEQRMILSRDEYGNLVQASSTERSTTTNFDGSVTQNTESTLDFLVKADQPYLTGRTDRTHTIDLIHNQESLTTSRLSIRLGRLGEVLDGIREADTITSNGDESLVITSHVKETFDRADKVNSLGLIRRETSSHTKNEVDFTEQDEVRVYLQNHDAFNRVTHAEETIKGHGTDDIGGWTETEGFVRYAVSQRTLQPYAVETTLHSASFDAFNQILTHSTQIQTVTADPETGRALHGKGRIESTSHLTDRDGNVIMVRRGDVYPPPLSPADPGSGLDPDEMIPRTTMTSTSEETYLGLEHTNGLGLVLRETVTENLNTVTHDLTRVVETLTQRINGVGKILSAGAITESETDDEWGHGTRHTETFVQTDYILSDGNEILPSVVKVVEVTKDRNDGSYRVVVREDLKRYDPYGRLLPINNEDPSEGGFQRIWYQDVTVHPMPQNPETPEEIFERFFGEGILIPPIQHLPSDFRVPPVKPWLPMGIEMFEGYYGWAWRGPGR